MAVTKQRDNEMFTKYEIAFQEDLKSLLTKFEQLKTYDYRSFAKLWSLESFGLIFVGKYRRYEIAHFTEIVLSCTKKYLVYPKSTYVRVGALFALYGLYYKQPFINLAKIRIVLPEMQSLRILMTEMKALHEPHPLYICNKMFTDDVFELVYSQHALGIDSRFMRSDLVLTNNTFCDTQVNLMELSRTVKEATADITKTDEQYQKKLKEYLRANNKSIETYAFNLRDELSQIVDQDLSPTTTDPTPIEAGPSIAERRKSIRSRAFTKKNPERKYVIRETSSSDDTSDNSFNESDSNSEPDDPILQK